MNTPRYDLVHITRTIDRHKKFILTITLICMVIGILFHFLRSKKYEAEAAFFIANPLYLDRSSMFTAADNRYVDYFGNEDDIDRVIALGESDTIIRQIIVNTGLDKSWNFNMADPFWANEAKKEFKDMIKIKRTEYTLMEVFFRHKDPVMAASVANETVRRIESGYRDFYISRRKTAALAISNKLHDVDSSIIALTDTLANLRAASGIMDVLSPSRANLITGTVKGNGGKDMGRYVEVIQNYESVKDQLVTDRARYISLLNQYGTGTSNEEMSLFHIITHAKPPVDPAGPTIWIILAASLVIGLLFSIVYVLLTGYYREVVTVRG